MHSMLLALQLGKFEDSLCKKTLVAWMSCINEPRDTFRWKKCLDSGIKIDKQDRSVTSEKETPRPTYTSRTRSTSQTSISLC